MGKNKTLLKVRPVAKDHFSSGKVKAPGSDLTRCVVRVFDGESLLASDAETGKSDPVCFIWVGESILRSLGTR
jgi:hypothetical protein